MLQRHHERAFQDLSVELAESQQWKPNELRRLYFPKDYTAFAYEPVPGLLAIGMMQLQCYISIPLYSHRYGERIDSCVWKIGSPRTIGTWKWRSCEVYDDIGIYLTTGLY